MTKDESAITTKQISSIADIPHHANDDDIEEFGILIGSTRYILHLRHISYREWMEIEHNEPPADIASEYSEVTRTNIYHPNHKDSRHNAQNRQDIINLKRTVLAIVEDIPGDTLEAKATYISDNFSAAALTALQNRVTKRFMEAAGNVKPVEHFHSDSETGTMGDGDLGEDA